MNRQAIRNIAACAGLLVLLGIGYLCLWPVPVEPVSWQASAPPGYTGPYAVNMRLANINLIELGNDYGPEHIAVGKGAGCTPP